MDLEDSDYKDLDFKKVAAFHGHACPGLALGYRLSLVALRDYLVKRDVDEEAVAIVENDSCAVDAVQFMTGCTFGKGNLIFKDYGKQVYTFIKRPPQCVTPKGENAQGGNPQCGSPQGVRAGGENESGNQQGGHEDGGGECREQLAEGFRLSVKWQSPPETIEESRMWERYSGGDRSESVLRAVHDRKSRKIASILDADDDELFDVTHVEVRLPEPARIHKSLICGKCGERVMETRTVVNKGHIYCIPCSGVGGQ
ncbi:MAG: formylmethanofuran dehydrogenase [Nitrospirae bacterium]|nr:formylmethanofuran dehydrogenase [Nitrospirota bacterium]